MDKNYITTLTRYIYRCSNKECRHAYALEFEVKYFPGTKVYLYKIENAPGWVADRIAERPYLRTPRQFTSCPECGSFAKMKPVKGHYNPDHTCNSKCMNAKSGECDCSCGGANHGKNLVA